MTHAIRPHRLAALGLAILALSACDQPQPPGVAPAPPSPVVATDERIGIPECDDYLDRYEACIAGHAPETARAALLTALAGSRASWRKTAASADHAALAAVCTHTRNASRPTMKAYGCADF
jgi:hypothetical protein